MIGPGEITQARKILDGIVHATPVMESASLSERVGGRLLTKAEHLQRTGSFKIRGAFVRISHLTESERSRGVVAASAGNHAQGVAWAASKLGVQATVVMPVFSALSKAEATRSYGASIELCGETFEESLARAVAVSEETGATLVHAFDDPWVIAGQGTVGLEILDAEPDVARIVVPVGGGGLAAGVAVAIKDARPDLPVIGVHPASTAATIADGAAVADRGTLTAEILDRLLDDLVEVDDEAVSEAIVLYLERTKQVVEGAGALGLAALLSGAVPASGGSLVVASGGNIDPGALMRVIRHGLAEAGRYLFIRVMLEDRPGRLSTVLQTLSELFVNVLSVVHHRAGLLPLGAVEVELTLETRDRSHAAEVVGALRSRGYEVRLG